MDIIEYWGSDNRIHQGTVTRAANGSQHWDSYHRQQVSLSGWHTFGMEWGPGYQIYNLDGAITNAIYGGYLPNEPHYILLNSGIESARPPRPGTTFPNDFVVDYVRVYSPPGRSRAPERQFRGGRLEALGPLERRRRIVDYGAKSGKRCLRVDGNSGENPASSAQQTVYGLKPGTRYTLTAQVRTIGKAQARLGVKEYGGDEARTDPMATSAYKEIHLTFTTGPTANSATIYCWGEGDGSAFFDEGRLAGVGSRE